MNDEVKSALDKVRKLLAMAAKDSGATEDERMTAMKLAMGLMAKHGIEQSMLGDAKAQKAVYGMRKSAEMRPYQVNLACAAGDLYGCTAMFWARGKMGFQFVGRPDNIEAAELTLLWLIKQVDDLYVVHRPANLAEGDRQKFWRSFKLGCSERVWSRARKYIAQPELIAADTGHNALVVKGYFDQLKAENAETTGKVKPMRVSRVKYNSAHGAGWKAGDKVQLHRQVR